MPDPPAPPPTPSPGLAHAVRTVALVTLGSRFGGMVRDVLLGRVFGDTPIASAFAAAFAIPNLFRRLFGEGALSAAFIPDYAQTHKADPARSDRFASLVVLALAAGASALTAVIELGLLIALAVLPADAERDLSLRLIMVMLPFMPLVCVAAILAGMLQVHGRFGAASSGPIVLNGFIVAVGLACVVSGKVGGEWTAYAIGAATVASGVTQVIWFLRLLRPHVRWTRVFTGTGDAARRMLRRFGPVVVGMGTLQINTFLDTLIAMWPIWVGPTVLGLVYPLDERSNGILSFTQRLYQFPLGVFGIAVATAVFPMLARTADEPARFAETLRRGLRLSLFIGVPASIGLWLVRHDLTATLFSGGKHGFSAEGLARSAAVLAGYAPGVWAYSLNHVYTRAFYARGDTRTPMNVAVVMVGFNLMLNLALIWPLREAGLAWATSITATIQCVVLGALCRSRVLRGSAEMPAAPAAGPRPADVLAEADRRAGTLGVLSVIAAGAMMAAGVMVVQTLLPRPAGWWGHAAGLAAATAIGLALYLAAAAAMRLPELRWLLRRGPDADPEPRP